MTLMASLAALACVQWPQGMYDKAAQLQPIVASQAPAVQRLQLSSTA